MTEPISDRIDALDRFHEFRWSSTASTYEAFGRHVPYFNAQGTKFLGAEPIDAFWRLVEHCNEDF